MTSVTAILWALAGLAAALSGASYLAARQLIDSRRIRQVQARGRHVRGYLRKDGTYVASYVREASGEQPTWGRVIATTARLWFQRRLLSGQAGTADRNLKAARPSRTASGLAGASTFLLPGADRTRYAEEHLGELWDVAQSGGSGLRQLLCALRQLRNAIPLRAAVLSPRRKNAAP
jgi:hypothetical protein